MTNTDTDISASNETITKVVEHVLIDPKIHNKLKSNYDKLSQALRAWYTPDQIEKIWAMLKEFDKQATSLTGSPGDDRIQPELV